MLCKQLSLLNIVSMSHLWSLAIQEFKRYSLEVNSYNQLSSVPSELVEYIRCWIKNYLYNSMQHFLFSSLSSDKSSFRINRCRRNQSPLYVYIYISAHREITCPKLLKHLLHKNSHKSSSSTISWQSSKQRFPFQIYSFPTHVGETSIKQLVQKDRSSVSPYAGFQTQVTQFINTFHKLPVIWKQNRSQLFTCTWTKWDNFKSDDSGSQQNVWTTLEQLGSGIHSSQNLEGVQMNPTTHSATCRKELGECIRLPSWCSPGPIFPNWKSEWKIRTGCGTMCVQCTTVLG